MTDQPLPGESERITIPGHGELVMHSTVFENGKVVREGDFNVGACPWLIIGAEHYRDDGSCRCDDKTHTRMREWGYKWSRKERRWTV